MSQQLHPQHSLPSAWASPASSGREPRFAFHRLMRRDPGYRWWRPLAIGGTALGFYLVLFVGLVVAVVIMALANPASWMGMDPASTMEVSDAMDMSDPGIFTLSMVSLILFIPACFVAYLLLGPKPAGLLLSVTGRLRWTWLGIATLASLVIFVGYFGLFWLLQQLGVIAAEEVPAGSLPDSPWLMIILVLLLVPFQSAAEEYLFRGLLMQVIGSWLRHPLFAILLPIPLFVVGHLYDVYGQIDVAVFALAAGYLTWRTGGLEAAIAFHAVNNVVLFLLGSIGVLDVNATESSLESLVSSVCLTALITYVMVRLAKKFNIQRTAGPAPLPVPSPIPWPVGVYPYQGPPSHPQQWRADPGYPMQPQGVGPPAPPHPTGAYWAPPPGQAPPARHGVESPGPGSDPGDTGETRADKGRT